MSDYIVMTHTAVISKRRWKRVVTAMSSAFSGAVVVRDKITVDYITFDRYPSGEAHEGRRYFKVYDDDGVALAAVVVFARMADLTLTLPERGMNRPVAAEILKGAGFADDAASFLA